MSRSISDILGRASAATDARRQKAVKAAAAKVGAPDWEAMIRKIAREEIAAMIKPASLETLETLRTSEPRYTLTEASRIFRDAAEFIVKPASAGASS